MHADGIILEARERRLGKNRRLIAACRPQTWLRWAEPFWILLGQGDGHTKRPRGFDQKRGPRDHPFSRMNRRNKLFLDINDQKLRRVPLQ